MAATNITFDDKILGQANALPENKKLTFTNANEIKTVVNNNATELTSTQANVATNTSGIATNVADIATNTTNIATNTTNIASNTSALDLKANLSGATFTGDVIAPDFIGDLNGAVRFNAKNESGSTLLKGKVVAITGVSGNETLVDLADADDVAARPAFGLVFANANNNAACEVVTFGNLSGLNTSAFTEGDTLYVSTVAGELVNVAPTGEAADIQNVGKVIRSHATEGIIKVAGAGRANATPNLDSGKMFLGNASNQSVSVAMSGDVTIDNTGVTTVGTINSIPVANITGNIANNATNIESNTTNIDANTINIEANTTNISTNTSNISTNTSNISTNASNIAANTTAAANAQSTANTALSNAAAAQSTADTAEGKADSNTAQFSDLNEQAVTSNLIESNIDTTYTLDLTASRMWLLTLTADTTINISDLSNSTCVSFTVKLTGDFVPTLTDVNVYGDDYDGTIQNLLTFNSYTTAAGTQVNDLIITNLA